jgi:UDP-N-acetylglucosamine 2-epimerase (non-hydrolysing)
MNNMNKIGICIGTRPEFIKCLPLLSSSDLYVPIFVQQHTDIMSVLEDRGHEIIPITDFGTNRLNNIMMSIINSTVFEKCWNAIMVQGDTAVAFAATLTAFHRRIPIIHLEAGLRTYDLEHPWPEEGYRQMIDSIATIALCPSPSAAQHLLDEKFVGRIEVVGNTSIDAIHQYALAPRIGKKVAITLHRRENWDQIQEFFEVIEELAEKHPDLTFVLPVHPNPDIRSKAAQTFQKVQVVDPLPHREMCELLAECNCIISDSGGIQEEASYVGKRVFCCRKITERSELVDEYITYTPTPFALREMFTPQTSLLPSSTVYGVGDAYLKINAILTTIFNV